jgi:hypothetical protein
MKAVSPLDYAQIKHLIPKSKSETLRLIDKIIAIELKWQVEFHNKFPNISDGGRPIYSYQDTVFTISFETYLRAELETYSKKTLDQYYKDVLDKQSQHINKSEMICDSLVKKYGYKSLKNAEQAFK